MTSTFVTERPESQNGVSHTPIFEVTTVTCERV